jgi:hypothetical protein
MRASFPLKQADYTHSSILEATIAITKYYSLTSKGYENNIVDMAFLVYNTFNKAPKLLSQRSLGKKGHKPGRTPREFPL